MNLSWISAGIWAAGFGMAWSTRDRVILFLFALNCVLCVVQAMDKMRTRR